MAKLKSLKAKPCCAAHGGPGKQCESVLEFKPEKRCSRNSVVGERYCSSHAPAPNLGLLMHEALGDRDDPPSAQELALFAQKHYAGGDLAEIARRFETFCDRRRDAKRRRTQ